MSKESKRNADLDSVESVRGRKMRISRKLESLEKIPLDVVSTTLTLKTKTEECTLHRS